MTRFMIDARVAHNELGHAHSFVEYYVSYKLHEKEKAKRDAAKANQDRKDVQAADTATTIESADGSVVIGLPLDLALDHETSRRCDKKEENRCNCSVD